ncbi:MAG: SPFH domain-containing protein [Cyanobium sp.]
MIEWSDAIPGAPDPGGDTLAWRFSPGDNPRGASTLINGTQLIVREGQWAVFLDEGRIADVFGPGRHTLSTANLPLLTSLLSLPTGFTSPFKAEVVFVATRLFCDLRWGTRQPLLLRDPELGPVRLRGFGSYSLRVNDPAWLVREVNGASGRLALAYISEPLRGLIVSRLADVLGRCGCPVFDLSSRHEVLARDLRLALIEDVQQYGLEIPSLLIEALTLPPEVEAALVRRSVRRLESQPAAAEPAAVPPVPRPPAHPPGAQAEAPASGVTPWTAADGGARPRRAPPPPPPPPLPARTSLAGPGPAARPEASGAGQAAAPQPATDAAASGPAGEIPQAGPATSGPGAAPAPAANTGPGGASGDPELTG